jgi:hypothetical protein
MCPPLAVDCTVAGTNVPSDAASGTTFDAASRSGQKGGQARFAPNTVSAVVALLLLPLEATARIVGLLRTRVATMQVLDEPHSCA